MRAWNTRCRDWARQSTTQFPQSIIRQAENNLRCITPVSVSGWCSASHGSPGASCSSSSRFSLCPPVPFVDTHIVAHGGFWTWNRLTWALDDTIGSNSLLDELWLQQPALCQRNGPIDNRSVANLHHLGHFNGRKLVDPFLPEIIKESALLKRKMRQRRRRHCQTQRHIQVYHTSSKSIWIHYTAS